MYATAVYLLEIFNDFFFPPLVQYGSLAEISISSTKSFASLMLWQGDWSRWPTEVPSNPDHSVIYICWFRW